ncbi:hypothetical protein NLG42_17450 [Flavobacterium plurextorum]|uniref:hypothetical protein n=1 Tax=Flavobacterium TaxID=237 RepID=UPI00214D1CA7|nr:MULTISPECIES: hypothetical protein [Flavobacterium]UUW07880.1 hypothetical protein NLG42_17450 [Flavobacterium plurextorum]
MNNEKLFKESIKFINENPNCLSNQVPQYLIEYWTTDNFNNEDLKATEQWSVFMHILIFKKELGVEFSIAIDEFEVLRFHWQAMLFAISKHNPTELRIKPFKIFDMENWKKIEIEYN